MKPNLKNVACVQIEALDPDRAARVLNWCGDCCDFGEVILISPTKPSCEFRGKWIQVPKFGYVGYSTLSVKNLYYFTEHEFVLNTQHDGFIIHPENWRKEFLDYDYIGAPWPQWVWKGQKAYSVGNSGFSLRSRKFLQACSEIDVPHDNEYDTPEARRYAPGVDGAADDIWMCQNAAVRKEMAARGIKYAPLEVARYFASELPVDDIPYDDKEVFGFHDLSPEHREPYKALVGWTPTVRPKVEVPKVLPAQNPPKEIQASAYLQARRKGKTVGKWLR